MTKMFSIVMIIAHWMACLFTAVARDEEWLTNDNWIIEKSMQDGHQFTVQYIAALYWAFTTMTTVGYGDITPINSTVKIVTMGMMCVSCAIFAWVMGYFGSIIAISDSSTKNLRDEI